MTLLRSFRFRIALLTASMAGAVLILFTGWAWRIVWGGGIERIDDQLVRATMPHMAWEHRPEDWEDIERGLQNALAFGDEDSVFLLATNESGDELFRSADWPGTLVESLLPPPTRDIGEPRGPRRGDGPPRLGPGRGPGPPLQEQGADREFREGRPPFERPGQGPREPVRAGFTTWNGAGASWRIGRFTNGHFAMTVGIDLASASQQQRDIGRALVAAALGGLLVLALGSFWIAQRALRPLAELADKTERINAHGLHERLSLDHSTAEFDRLVVVFNAMLERLESSFRQATRFSADAAHELKTPITILQGLLDDGIKRGVLTSAEEQRFRKMLDEVQRLKGIIQKLLTLSLADAGRLRLEKEDVDLSAMLRETAEDIEILAPGLTVKLTIEDGLIVPADHSLLRQVFQNLVNNAIRYNTPDGRIWMQARRRKNSVEVMISNTGRAIPEADRDKIFQRFHRVDASRGRESGGAGLGLSLVHELVLAHGGEIGLKPEKDGVVSFVVRLPLKK